MRYRVMLMIPKEEGDREDVFDQRWACQDKSSSQIRETENEMEASVFQDVVEAVKVADDLKCFNHYYDYVTIELIK